jgi:peptidoglycan/xylan/chitin deacetylase (PgdA/CDA1 family)
MIPTKVLGHVALTFDGGPHPESTGRLLDLLDRCGGVRATFFLLGHRSERHPATARAIAEAGHETGVCPATGGELLREVGAVAAATGTVPYWCRPHNEARRLGLRAARWTCQGRDETPGSTADSVYRSVLRRLDCGGTIMLHHTPAALAALPAILTTCRARGLRVGPLREHATALTAAPRRIMEVR